MKLGFRPRFVEKVRSGDKRHSMRRGTRWTVGRRADLYEKDRQPGMKLIFRAPVTRVEPVTIRPGRAGSMIVTIDLNQLDAAECETFARADGFADFADFCAYWKNELGPREVWRGQVIHWDFERRFTAMPTPDRRRKAARPNLTIVRRRTA